MKTVTPAPRALGFYIHAMAIIPSMVLLLAIDLLTGAPFWVHWVLLGWVPGLLAHGWFTVGPGAAGCRTRKA